jgi:hypothetical protein
MLNTYFRQHAHVCVMYRRLPEEVQSGCKQERNPDLWSVRGGKESRVAGAVEAKLCMSASQKPTTLDPSCQNKKGSGR